MLISELNEQEMQILISTSSDQMTSPHPKVIHINQLEFYIDH